MKLDELAQRSSRGRRARPSELFHSGRCRSTDWLDGLDELDELISVYGIAKTNAVGEPGCGPLQKGDGPPDITATYCFPFTS